jgi:hypothetical protein
VSKRGALVWALWFACVGCNFDAAFNRYCQGNPNCRPDAARGPEVRPVPSPDVTPPDLAPPVTPDVGPALGVDAPVDATFGRFDVGGGPPPIRPFRSCSSPADCNGPGETCHPGTQVCIPTCRSPSDCPPWLDKCIDVRGQPGGPNPPTRICACSNSQICGQYLPNSRCNDADNLCQPACYSSADCSGLNPPRMCNPFTQICVECITSTDCSSRDGLPDCDSTGRCVSH